MNRDPRLIAVIGVAIAILGVLIVKSRGDDNILPSPSSATSGPGAAAVEDAESATPSVTPDPYESEDEGDEADLDSSDDASDDNSDSSDDSSDDEDRSDDEGD